MSLKRTELLCLRVSDGLGRKRDFDELERRGIDSKSWSNIGKQLSRALKPAETPPNLLDRIMDTILSQEVDQDENLYGDALLPENQPDIASAVLNTLDIACSELADTLSPKESPEINEDVLRRLDINSERIDLRRALVPAVKPDLTDKIMNAISSTSEVDIDIGSALKAQTLPDLSDSIFAAIESLPPKVAVVEEQIIDESTLSEQEVDLGLNLGDLLRPNHRLDLWSRIQSRLEISSKDAESEDRSLKLINDNQNPDVPQESGESQNNLVVLDFPSGDLDFPVDDSSEVEEPQSGSFAMMGVGLVFAVAAGLLMMFQFGGSVETPIAPGEEVFSVAAVNELEVESLEVGDDIMVQIFQSEENAPTIIFIDDSLVIGDEE